MARHIEVAGWRTDVEVVVTVGIVDVVGAIVHEQVVGVLVVRVCPTQLIGAVVEGRRREKGRGRGAEGAMRRRVARSVCGCRRWVGGHRCGGGAAQGRRRRDVRRMGGDGVGNFCRRGVQHRGGGGVGGSSEEGALVTEEVDAVDPRPCRRGGAAG
jgi:hypothetical protein